MPGSLCAARMLNRSMDRNSPDSLRLQTNDGRYINHLASAELGYDNKQFNGQLAYGESQDYFTPPDPTRGLQSQ
ncbi:Uncharacterised protein [Serratia fonticola]|uniref:Uncharacterized protein n=1 Tax=Serratia fonticola TaxID=47917 RepID=A0A4U9WMV0_SERFO|nr:Uncharacterised protein [Serratia fonticola]